MSEKIGIKDLFDRINNEIAIEQKIPLNILNLVVNGEGQNESESVWIKEPLTGKMSKLLFNCSMRGRKNDKYATFVVQSSILDNVVPPKNAELKTIVSDKLHTYINVKEIDAEFETFLKQLISYSVKNFEPADKFGCCSKYKECSKEKECLHDDLFYSKACYYRKNLESGKIFY